MPERTKYERIGDEEQGIKLNDMTPKHAYLDGDSVVSEPPAPKETTPMVAAAAVAPAVARMPRAPTAPYPLHDDDDGYHPPPPAVLPAVGYSSGRSSPARRDYQPSPVRQATAYHDEPAGYGYAAGLRLRPLLRDERVVRHAEELRGARRAAGGDRR